MTLRRVLISILTAAGLVCVAPAGSAMAAADPVETFTNGATGLCLEYTPGDAVVGTGGPVSNCANDATRQWAVHHWADGTVRLENVALGECLQRGGQTDAMVVAPCNAETVQSWWVYHYADGGMEFKSQADPASCLDDSFDYGTRLFACGTHAQESPYQTWY